MQRLRTCLAFSVREFNCRGGRDDLEFASLRDELEGERPPFSSYRPKPSSETSSSGHSVEDEYRIREVEEGKGPSKRLCEESCIALFPTCSFSPSAPKDPSWLWSEE